MGERMGKRKRRERKQKEKGKEGRASLLRCVK